MGFFMHSFWKTFKGSVYMEIKDFTAEDDKARTISDLLSADTRLYVYCCDKNISRRFMADAQREGFTFGDGAKPTERPTDDIIAINNDKTINYVGFVGHLAFKTAFTVAGKALVKVDYKKYISGNKYYFYTHS